MNGLFLLPLTPDDCKLDPSILRISETQKYLRKNVRVSF